MPTSIRFCVERKKRRILCLYNFNHGEVLGCKAMGKEKRKGLFRA